MSSDKQVAAAIVADSRNACDETAMEAAIVRALQAARESSLDTHANAAVLRMCHEARMMNGIVDYSDPNATGVVRKVLGTLPVTADGCVVDDHQIHHPEKGAMFAWKDGVGVWRAKPWLGDYKGACLLSECYSTFQAAKSAKSAKEAKT